MIAKCPVARETDGMTFLSLDNMSSFTSFSKSGFSPLDKVLFLDLRGGVCFQPCSEESLGNFQGNYKYRMPCFKRERQRWRGEGAGRMNNVKKEMCGLFAKLLRYTVFGNHSSMTGVTVTSGLL